MACWYVLLRWSGLRAYSTCKGEGKGGRAGQLSAYPAVQEPAAHTTAIAHTRSAPVNTSLHSPAHALAWLSMRAVICLLAMSAASSFSRPLRNKGERDS